MPDNPIYGGRAGQEIDDLPVIEVTYWGFRMMTGFGGLAAAAAWALARKGSEGRAFTALGLFLVLGSASIFAAVFPVVPPSTLDEAFDLTISNASSSDYTLGLMSVVAAIGLPLVIAYQAWTYWVFRNRVSATHIPEARSFLPATAAKAFTRKH